MGKSGDPQTPQPEGGLSPWGWLRGPRGLGGVALFFYVRDPVRKCPPRPSHLRTMMAAGLVPSPERQAAAPCRPALLPGERGHAIWGTRGLWGAHTNPRLVTGLLLSEAQTTPRLHTLRSRDSTCRCPGGRCSAVQELGSPHTCRVVIHGVSMRESRTSRFSLCRKDTCLSLQCRLASGASSQPSSGGLGPVVTAQTNLDCGTHSGIYSHGPPPPGTARKAAADPRV